MKENSIVKMKLLRKELLYDVENNCYIEADALQEGGERLRNLIADMSAEGCKDKVNRMMALAFHDVQEQLYPYCKKEVISKEVDNVLEDAEDFELVMSLPHDFSDTSVMLLKHLVHEYIVCRVVGDWVSTVKPSSFANWESKALYLKKRLQTFVINRTGVVRRKLSVF